MLQLLLSEYSTSSIKKRVLKKKIVLLYPCTVSSGELLVYLKHDVEKGIRDPHRGLINK